MGTPLWTIGGNNIVYIGMDVPKTFNLCTSDGTTGEIFWEVRYASDVKLVKNYR